MFTPMSDELARFFPDHAALVRQHTQPSPEKLKARLAGARWISLTFDKVIVGLPARRSKVLDGEWAELALRLCAAGDLHQLLPRLGRNGIPVFVNRPALDA